VRAQEGKATAEQQLHSLELELITTVSCSVLQCVLQCVLPCVAVCCSVLQRVAACCSVVHSVASLGWGVEGPFLSMIPLEKRIQPIADEVAQYLEIISKVI